MEEHAFIHENDVFIEEEQKVDYDTSSKLTNETDGTSVLNGEDEDMTSCPAYDDYEKMFQSYNVNDSLPLHVYDSDDGDSSRRNSVRHPIYDTYDEENMIVTELDKDLELCLEVENKEVYLGDERI